LDIKDHAGYVIVAPSIHPDTGKPYTFIDGIVAAPPEWLIQLITPVAPDQLANALASSRTVQRVAQLRPLSGPSIADAFCESTTWAEILMPHGWTAIGAETEEDSRWLHPAATSKLSATVRYDRLFVYSTSTVFTPTTAGDNNGVTKFKAYAALNYGGDTRAAAKALRTQRQEAS
jgi:hypothetical protein